jgi:hypothetical protein
MLMLGKQAMSMLPNHRLGKPAQTTGVGSVWR